MTIVYQMNYLMKSEAAQISAPFRRYSSEIRTKHTKSILLTRCPAVLLSDSSKVSYQRFPNLLGTAARIEGKGMRTIPPLFFAGCGNYSHPNGLKWWNRSNLSETPNKKVRVQRADFSAHRNFVVTQRQMVLSTYFSFTTSPPEI